MSETAAGRPTLFEQYRWLPFVLPFVLFMVGNVVEGRVTGASAKAPAPAEAAGAVAADTVAPDTVAANAGAPPQQLAATRSWYPLVYTLKIAAVIASLVWVWPAYRAAFPYRLTPWSVAVGVVGVVLWVSICKLGLEAAWLPRIGLGSFVDKGARAGFNPLAEMADQPLLAYAFLAVRFVGLAAVVPILEEMFLRGWLMRFVTRADWWNVGLGEISTLGLALGTLVPMAMHPEIAAAAVWFTMVTALMLTTKNIWDCIAAHAITNLLLGVYVVATGSWELM